MNKEKRLYLIDGTAYIHRAYHAIRRLSNSTGLPTNAIFGFTRMLLKLMREQSPEYAAMFFDTKGPTFRHEIFRDYKANRPPMPEDMAVQIPYIKHVTAGLNLPIFEMPGFEADDLIGTLARMAQESGFYVIMVTGDKDFRQLVTDMAIILDPMKGKTIDAGSIRESGVEPHQLIDVMALSGDASDNIPGVPGIGPKNALSLIQSFVSLKGLYEKVDTITRKKQRENLIKYKDQAFMSKELVTIKTDVPILLDAEALKVKSSDNIRLSRLFKELEFREFQQDFHVSSDSSNKSYKLIQDINSISDLISDLKSAGTFAIDTETTSRYPLHANLVGLSFSMKSSEAFYIPCAHEYAGVPEQPELSAVLKLLQPVLESPDIKKIGQNIKYDWIVLARHGINLDGVMFDTMLASYLLNPSKHAHGLDQIAIDFLDHKTIKYQDVTGKNALGFAEVPLEKAVPYACEDADITLMAKDVLMSKLEELGLKELFDKVEMPLVPVLMRMEMAGICVEKEKLHTLSKEFSIQLEALESRIYEIAGEKFNIRSSQQLGNILFEKLNLPLQKKTRKKTGYSTDGDVLRVLAGHHELPSLILKHRTLAKLKSTYADALIDLINPETGRIHTSYNQTVTATGRLSSSDPNLQNIPIRMSEGREIRRAFVPKDGWYLVSADYSQVELRILAHYSDDSILVKAFKDDEDVHTRTATEVFDVIPAFVTPELRRQAKAINFGIIYGMSAYGLSKQLDISHGKAKTYIENYFARYKGIKHFMNQTIEDARTTKRTSTLLGRIRFLPDINSPNRNIRQFAERTAINTPIQGTAADLIKIAMIKVDAEFQERKLKSAMLLSVHDELVFEVSPDELDEVKGLVKETMEGIWALRVPLKVNMASGKNWDEAH